MSTLTRRHGLFSWVATIALTGTLAGGIFVASPRFHALATQVSAAPATTTAGATATTGTTTTHTPIVVYYRGDDGSQGGHDY